MRTNMNNIKIDDLKRAILDLLDERLPENLFYHNRSHTKDVYEAAKDYSEREGIPNSDIKLLLAAALLHDTGFTVRYDNNEEEAVKIARSLLPRYNFSRDKIQTVSRIIFATKMPQNPKTRLEEILCDADLDYLGRSDFEIKSDLLRAELQIFMKTSYPNISWYLKQIDFLKNHTYFTDSAKKLRDKGKQRNIRELENRIKK